MLPSLTPLTRRDLEALDALRIERFMAFFAPRLKSANTYLCGLDRTLIVTGGSEIQELLSFQSELVRGAWYMLAATNILIYQYNQLIYQAENINDKLGENAAVEFEAMVAIQEKMSADTVVENGVEEHKTNAAQIVRSVSVADLAADLEAKPDSIQEFLEKRGAKLIDFGGTIIVPESEAVIVYEHYSLIRARQKMLTRFAAASTQAGGEKPQTKSSASTATKENKPKKPTLTFKGTFKPNRSNYKRTIENFQKAMFPDSPSDQDQALTDIVQQTEMGKAYLDKIVRVGEYKDKEHARVNLLKAAAQLQEKSDEGDRVEENVVAE